MNGFLLIYALVMAIFIGLILREVYLTNQIIKGKGKRDKPPGPYGDGYGP